MTERKMTKETYDYLQARAIELNNKVRTLSDGFSGHQRAMLHDDAGTHHSITEAKAELDRIGNLQSIQLIQPREDISNVGVGNEVSINFDGDEEKYLFLSKDDVVYRKDLGLQIISEDSPIGQLIIGRKCGQSALLKLKNGDVNIKINSIQKGTFE